MRYEEESKKFGKIAILTNTDLEDYSQDNLMFIDYPKIGRFK